MINTGKLAGKTVFITGATRGIGKAIALKVAKDGANVVVAAKSAKPHPKLPGTIYSAAEDIEKAGGKALACLVDVRDEAQVQSAVDETVKKFGGIDIVVNNASAINLVGTEDISMKQYDLMNNINARGTFLVSKLCIPHLKKSQHAHILNLSPPLDLKPLWFAPHVAYTTAKYGMSFCVLGMHEELRPYNIAVNALWPRTVILTAALDMLMGKEASKFARKPEIMSDSAYAILIQDPKSPNSTGKFHIDEDVLKSNGVQNLEQYCVDPAFKDQLMNDLYVGASPVQESVAAKDEGAQSAGGSDKLNGLFKKIEGALTEDIVKSTGATFQFVVTGKEQGSWYVDLKSGKGACGRGDAPEKADATLQMNSDHLLEMFAGKLKPATAYMTGKMKISGNLPKALKLEKLLGRVTSK